MFRKRNVINKSEEPPMTREPEQKKSSFEKAKCRVYLKDGQAREVVFTHYNASSDRLLTFYLEKEDCIDTVAVFSLDTFSYFTVEEIKEG